MTRILVTGSREWPSTYDALEVIFHTIDKHCELSWTYPEVIHGMSDKGGVDAYVHAYCRGAGYGVTPYEAKPSDGRTYCIAKDYAKRNRAMVDSNPDLVLAFFLQGAGNRGTQMTVDMAKRAGIRVEEIWYG